VVGVSTSNWSDCYWAGYDLFGSKKLKTVSASPNPNLAVLEKYLMKWTNYYA
jgi:hypothetical protein